jgi:hypothetical protein
MICMAEDGRKKESHSQLLDTMSRGGKCFGEDVAEQEKAGRMEKKA